MAEGVFIIEPAGKFLKLLFKVSKIYALKKSQYQEIVLAEIEGFGKALILDKFIQSTEKDEHIYHELLVHPAMTLHPNPRRILIIGGGEGATLREVLKHNTVEEAIMVDIDSVVVEFSKKYLGIIHQESFNDKRAKVIIMDGKDYVEQASNESFDVIIMDLTDPYAGDVAKPLYSSEFFMKLKRVLKRNGVLATQAGSSYFYSEEYNYVLNNIKKVFKNISEYWFWLPSFGLNVNFIVASDEYNLMNVANMMDERLNSRGVKTKFIKGSLMEGLLKIGVLYP
ncbi:MAG: hypothetical protein NZ922_03315 [Candidatus Methanomethyliaceae archaeon]|nr:hypothetical protein [Candidatus Methanomethyliaceae archaeon]MDW7970534.1 spermidine synthase [Nitrososphaerota archaeon]